MLATMSASEYVKTPDEQSVYQDTLVDTRSVDTELRVPILRNGGSDTTYVKANKHIALTLLGQVPDAVIPLCDDASALKGHVSLHNVRGVSAVELHIEGSVRLHEFGGLKRTTSVLSQTLSLWSGPETDAERLPRALPFTYRIPSDARLPPSFEAKLGSGSFGNKDANGFNAWVRYRLVVRVKARDAPVHIGPLDPLFDRSLVVPILFTARLRAPHESLPDVTALVHGAGSEGVGEALEATLRNRSAKLPPIRAAVRVPQPLTFCMRRPIPIFLRLLNERGGGELGAYDVRVSLLRKTTQIVPSPEDNSNTWMEAVDAIGTGALVRVEASSDAVAWAGEMSVHPSVRVGSFSVDGLTVKDYIVLDIVPPKNKPGLLLVDPRLSIPVTLTTD